MFVINVDYVLAVLKVKELYDCIHSKKNEAIDSADVRKTSGITIRNPVVHHFDNRWR